MLLGLREPFTRLVVYIRMKNARPVDGMHNSTQDWYQMHCLSFPYAFVAWLV